MGLGVPVPRIVGQVLGHGLVGVEPHLAEAMAARLLLGQGKQAGPDTEPLRRRQHGHVLKQQVIGLADQHEEADDHVVSHRHPDLVLTHGPGVIGRHRRRGAVHARQVAPIGRHRHRAHARDVLGGGGTEDR
jgi:hypothetical protein